MTRLSEVLKGLAGNLALLEDETFNIPLKVGIGVTTKTEGDVQQVVDQLAVDGKNATPPKTTAKPKTTKAAAPEKSADKDWPTDKNGDPVFDHFKKTQSLDFAAANNIEIPEGLKPKAIREHVKAAYLGDNEEEKEEEEEETEAAEEAKEKKENEGEEEEEEEEASGSNGSAVKEDITLVQEAKELYEFVSGNKDERQIKTWITRQGCNGICIQCVDEKIGNCHNHFV